MTIEVGSFLLLRYGRGTQVCQVIGETAKHYKIRRFNQSGAHAGWMHMPATIGKGDARILGAADPAPLRKDPKSLLMFSNDRGRYFTHHTPTFEETTDLLIKETLTLHEKEEDEAIRKANAAPKSLEYQNAARAEQRYRREAEQKKEAAEYYETLAKEYPGK